MKYRIKEISSYWILGVLVVLMACKSAKTSHDNSQMAEMGFSKEETRVLNRILLHGLDHEALYTLIDSIKPMSSLVTRSFPVANIESALKTSANVVLLENERYLDSIRVLQEMLEKFQMPDVKLVAVPYRNTGKKLVIQLSAVRISSLNKILWEKRRFFGQFGLVPGTDPYLVLSTIENADKSERFRGYGYLFGYPEYAVDFFVDAARVSESSKRTEPRNFFQIPAYAGNRGIFVYAYPQDKQPTADVDSVLYKRAEKTLQSYKILRSQYMEKDSSVDALSLLRAVGTINKKKVNPNL